MSDRASHGRRVLWLALLGAVGLLLLLPWWMSRGTTPSGTATPVDKVVEVGPAPVKGPLRPDSHFVGSTACSSCHQAEHAAWQKSQHAKAMQHASPDSVLGDFNDVSFQYDGVTSRFFMREGKFFVRTDGPDGKPTDFQVKYTFGVSPLQQYLVELPGGRLQALSVTWDTRPRSEGGQRWFRQYPGEKIDHRDELHWTRRSQNWNFMCADCHSTDVRKGYSADTQTFDTRYAEVSVGCEACHGPGSGHVGWAQTRPASDPSKGLTVRFDERRGVSWAIDPVSGNARRSTERRTDHEMQACASCHARRAQIAEGYRAGRPFMDHYLPSTLSEGLYHPDGQQRDEVFVWGSFMQSRMHAAGVTCSDCHDPHTQALRAPGNAQCGQCHSAAKYDAKAHHFHDAGSPAAQCVNCHMPQTTYMVVDPRRDHSFRVPRPDLSVAIGTPNACNACHKDQSAGWAQKAIADWYGPSRRQEAHFGQVLQAGRTNQPGAARSLSGLLTDVSQPAIVRATAIDLLAQYPGRRADELLRQALKDPDPLVRHSAVLGQQSLPPERLASILAPVLKDPIRAVRIEAAQLLAGAGPLLDPGSKEALEAALREYETAQREDLSRPEALTNLGNLRARRGQPEDARTLYQQAISLEPRFVPAYVNLADLHRAAQRDAQAEQVLRDGLSAVPTSPALREALGLTLVRRGRKADALAEFAAAHRAAPEQPRYAYVHALALDDAGRRSEAIRILVEAGKRGGSRDIWLALASLRSQAGDADGAAEALKALGARNPDDPALAQLSGQR